MRRGEHRLRTPTQNRLSIFAYVLSGEIESQVNDGPKRVYRAGESFYETPGSSHPVSRNASKTEPAKLLEVFVVDTDDKAPDQQNSAKVVLVWKRQRRFSIDRTDTNIGAWSV